MKSRCRCIHISALYGTTSALLSFLVSIAFSGVAQPTGKPTQQSYSAVGWLAKIGLDSMVIQADQNSLTLLPDGKILVAGGSRTGYASAREVTDSTISFREWQTAETIQQIILKRFYKDGAIDSDFGDSGTVRFGIDSLNDELKLVALQNDGRIILVSDSYDSTDHYRAIFRRNPDGTVDSTYGDAGTVLIHPTENDEFYVGAALLPDNRVLIVTQDDVDSFRIVARFYCFGADGRPDPGFGNSGLTLDTLSGVWHLLASYGNPIQVRTDGSVSIVWTSGSWPKSKLIATRYDLNGRRVADGFGVGFNASDSDVVSWVKQLPDGQSFVVNKRPRRVSAPSYRSEILRFTAEFRADTSFCPGCSAPGRVVINDRQFKADHHSMCLLPDGSLLALGEFHFSRPERLPADVAVFSRKLGSRGEWDSSFGSDGLIPFTDKDERLDFSPFYVSDGNRLYILSDVRGEGSSRLKLLITALR